MMMPVSNLSTGNGHELQDSVMDQVPAGLRVLVVDRDTTSLKILEQMLRLNNHQVTTCSRAEDALSLLQDRKGCFDLVISEVHMAGMDGFELLELVGLEMDLPVIMMSANDRVSDVMKGIKHVDCDSLNKPVHLEEFMDIWQHAVRKRLNENKEHEQSSSLEDSDRNRRGVEDVEYTPPVNGGAVRPWKAQKKKREAKEDEDDGELENDDPSSTKKRRVAWPGKLHDQFLIVVNQLGIDKAYPKRILELMNVPGLTYTNISSHLQKYKIALKKAASGQIPEAQTSGASHAELMDRRHPAGSSIVLHTALKKAASGQIPEAQTSGASHAELMDRRHPAGSSIVLHTALKKAASSQIPEAQTSGVSHAELMDRRHPGSNIVLHTALDQTPVVPRDSIQGPLDLDWIRQLEAHMMLQQQPLPIILTKPSRGINVQQPSTCLVVPPSLSPNNSFQGGNN